MAIPQQVKKLTRAEYLAIEREAESRSQFYDGEMFAMAGGSARHSLIKTNITAELRNRLKGRPCRAYDSDLRILISDTGLYTYPDASVICGPLEYDSSDDRRNTVTNPTLLVEVVSESTEAYDRGKKFGHYRRIASFREYLIVWQDEPKIERYLRNADGTWTLTEIAGLDASLSLSSIEIDLPLREVYDAVDFSQPESPHPPA
jgi:Uma2 family endonuclease